MKISFFSGDITRSGGTERVATTIANGLSHTGKYEISFVSLVEQEKEPFYPIDSQIQRFVLKKDRKWVSPGPGYLPFVPALRRFLKEWGTEILIDIDIVLDVLSLFAVRGRPVKVISWEHFNCFYEQESLYRRWILRLSVRFSDYIVTLTEQDKQNYEKLLRRRERITFINNPVGIVVREAAERKKIVITVGHLIHRKGIDMLIQIVPSILQKYKDWKWYFLGDGEYRKDLEEVQKAYGLEGRLVLKGVVKEPETYLTQASIFVLASRAEGWGMCLAEAMVCGVPCIAFDIPIGPSEMICHGVNGFLIAPFDLEEMRKRIVQLIEDSEMRRDFSLATMKGMEKYQLEKILKKWEWLLDTA